MFKEYTDKQFIELNSKRMNLKRINSLDTQRGKKPTNIRLNEMINTIWYLKSKFRKDIETLKITQLKLK